MVKCRSPAFVPAPRRAEPRRGAHTTIFKRFGDHADALGSRAHLELACDARPGSVDPEGRGLDEGAFSSPGAGRGRWRELTRHTLLGNQAFKVEHKQIDGADPVNKDLRNELFGISNLRGVYPQVFLTNKADSTVFVGDFAKISSLVENNDLPEGSPEAFNTVFANAKQ